MVKERSPSRTSSGQHLSPQKSERQPLANISAKMQSPSPKQDTQAHSDTSVKPVPQAEFGKSSPLRNPLKRQEPNIFIPKAQSAHRPNPSQNPMYSTQPSSHAHKSAPVPPEQRSFYMPGQRSHLGAPPQASSAWAAAQAYMEQPYNRSFSSDVIEVPRPANIALPTVPARPQPTFSSIGPKTFYQPFQPPKSIIDLTQQSVEDDNDFDPDAALKVDSGNFGAVDPYMYVDSTQANENIKNLLEGAFDDEDDKSKTRLRRRAKKALNEGKDKEAKSLADKLAALDVKEKEAKTAEKPDENEDEEEEEDGTVEGLSIKLLPHQVEGVAWMIDKEIGVRKRNGVLPHGGILADDMGLGKTIQSISLILTNARPSPGAKPEHKGQKMPGLDVGKGTLVVAPLALIKQWEDEIKTKVSRSHALRVLVHHGPSRTKSAADLKKYDVVITTYQTLTSEHQGSNLDRPDGTRIGCFGVHWYRIILDEAHSIKNRNAKSTLAACALNSWYRWCLTGTPMQNNLDELQSLIKFLRIKPYCELQNWKAQITSPIKNGRGGLGMKRLQYFLKAFMKRRTKDILKKEGALNFGGKSKEGESKGDTGGMKIVKREIVSVECDFDAAELEFYSRLENRADQRLKDMAKEGAKANYMGALVLLLRLRQACNHPHLIENAVNKDKDAMTTGIGSGVGNGIQTPRKQSKDDDGMDDLTTLMGGVSVGTKQCDVCQIELTSTEAKEGLARCSECEADLKAMKGSKKLKPVNVKKDKVEQRRARNRRVIIDSDDDDNSEGEGEWIADGPERRMNRQKAGGTDDEDAEGGGETLDSIDSDRSADDDEDVNDSPPRARRHTHGVEAESDSEEEAEDDEHDDNGSDAELAVPIIRGMESSGKAHGAPSTKIRKLLRILHNEAPKHKTIVFSQFTTMLDLIEPHLQSSKIKFVRYDGSMRPDAREASLHSLRNDKKCRVLLCSLKCGSLGLNLTAASRVVIIEPFWNPFVEEQAIDRVHRLNQTVDVKVYRLTVRNTVEGKIVDLQERKRELAAAAIEGGNAVNKLSMQDILSLFRHDAEHSTHHQDDKEMWEKFGSDSRLLDGSSGTFAGDSQGRKLASASHDRARAAKPGKERLFKEHDVFGRRW